MYLFVLIYGGNIAFKKADNIGFLGWIWVTLWVIAVGGSILGSIKWIVDNVG